MFAAATPVGLTQALGAMKTKLRFWLYFIGLQLVPALVVVRPADEQGVGLQLPLSDGTGVDPQVWMQYSDDSGESWTNQQSAPIGVQGRYDNRTMFRGLGPSRNRVWRVVMTDPVPFILVGLVAIASPCKF